MSGEGRCKKCLAPRDAAVHMDAYWDAPKRHAFQPGGIVEAEKKKVGETSSHGQEHSHLVRTLDAGVVVELRCPCIDPDCSHALLAEAREQLGEAVLLIRLAYTDNRYPLPSVEKFLAAHPPKKGGA